MSLEPTVAFTATRGWHIAIVDTEQMLATLADHDPPPAPKEVPMTRTDLGDGGPPLDLPDSWLPDWQAHVRAAVARRTRPPLPPPTTHQETVMPTNAKTTSCATPNCGTAMTGAGAKRGWILMRIVGSGDAPRRWCSIGCAGLALANSSALRLVEPPATLPRPDEHKSKGRGTRDLAVRVQSLGTTSRDIKAWAVTRGLIPEVTRGSVSARLIDAWELAHTRKATA